MTFPLARFLGCALALHVVTACGNDSGPDIRHAVASTADDRCAACHRPHDSGCVSCHAVKESWLPLESPPTTSPSGSAPPTPHETPRTDDSACGECHVRGEWQAPISSHPTQAGCVACHGSS
jgi:hypothetical protein